MAKNKITLRVSIDELDLFVDVIEACGRACETHPGLPALKEIKEKITILEVAQSNFKATKSNSIKLVNNSVGKISLSIPKERSLLNIEELLKDGS